MDIAYIVKKLESKQSISEPEVYEIQEYLSDIMIALDRNDKINDRFFELYNSCVDNFNSCGLKEYNDISEIDSDIIVQEFKYKVLSKVAELHKSYIRELFCMIEPIDENQKEA